MIKMYLSQVYIYKQKYEMATFILATWTIHRCNLEPEKKRMHVTKIYNLVSTIISIQLILAPPFSSSYLTMRTNFASR